MKKFGILIATLMTITDIAQSPDYLETYRLSEDEAQRLEEIVGLGDPRGPKADGDSANVRMLVDLIEF